MPEQKKETAFSPAQTNGPDAKPTTGPREFIMRYIKYMPWVLFSAILFGVLAYIKIRYTTPIYVVQSSLLIKNESSQMGGNGGKDISFNELFMNQGTLNLNNEVEILRSRPVLQRVARDL